MPQPVSNIAFAKSESLLQEALSLYKSKQFEEALFHFLDAAKIGGLSGGEAEYYVGHIYFEKLNDNVLAHKYLTIAYEKRHILHPLSVHQLQNHFHDMTKVLLNEESYS